MTRVPITVVDLTTGQIVTASKQGVLPHEVAIQAGPGQAVFAEFHDSATEMWDVVHGDRFKRKPAEKVSVQQVKAEAARRLAETDWMRLRELDGGAPMPDHVVTERNLIRQRSGELERMRSIPQDYTADHYWV